MAGAIWSMPQKDIMNYPIKSLFEFFNNHKLLHGKKDRPQWLTISGGSINYVKKIISFLEADHIWGEVPLTEFIDSNCVLFSDLEEEHQSAGLFASFTGLVWNRGIS